MSNEKIIDQFDINLRLFFDRFVKAVESKNEQELDELISDSYRSESLMNRTKEELISFIVKFIPNNSLLKLKIQVEFCRVDFNQDEQAFDVTIKPNYSLKLFWINLVDGVFGRAEKVDVRLEKDISTKSYCIVKMEDSLW